MRCRLSSGNMPIKNKYLPWHYGTNMKTDVIIIGSGAAGLMCALQAGQRGRSVMLLDHAKKLAEKIRISGGGHCNFTNLNSGPENFVSANPNFCRSALRSEEHT